MNFIADRKGKITEENSFQNRLLGWLYGHMIGRIILKPLIMPAFSKIGGKILNSSFSKILIQPFIRSHSICMEDFQPKKYTSYNDFFTRKLRPKARRIEQDASIFISPCDSRLSVYPIEKNLVFSIKHTNYTIESLLKNRKWAKKFEGGYLWIFRLCTEDYHRYIYIDQGKVSANYRIPGVFHTVNPVAQEKFPIYKENTREYSLLASENFGYIVQMEVGAMLVGKIENKPGKKRVKRGEEKGNFAFGGSTIILITQKGKVCPDKDIVRNSKRGIETKVKLGERVGEKTVDSNIDTF